MRLAVLAAAAVLLLSSAVALRAAAGIRTHAEPRRASPMTTPRTAEPTEGTWTLEVRDGAMHITLLYGTGTWGRPIDRAALVGLTDAQVNAAVSTPVAFRIEREAGDFDLEGAFREGRGAGHFRFHPDRGFVSTLRGLGVRDADGVEDRELMVMALGNATGAALRELAGLGVRPETTEDVIQLAV
ncbi:MAG TPA: hypothetical protein VFZ20_03305, partial [Longimicrobium sp.]